MVAVEIDGRQLEVLRHIARGHSRKEIAARMGISPRTVDSHIGKLLMKTNLHDQLDLLRWAIKQGFITIEEFLHGA
jgi:DNA-binding CsgD family transcriptional regulator